MRKQLSKTIFILIISLFIHPLYSQVELTEEHIQMRREPLKGIQGIYVLIEFLPADAKQLGITKESLKTKVELKLRLAGIRILSSEEHLKSSETVSPSSILYVNLNIVSVTSRDTNIYASDISIELQEKATIKRNKLVDRVTVWKESTLGVYNTKEGTLKGIKESLKKNTDIFLNDYLAVNPKK